MTAEEWIALQVGDVILDRKCRDAEREVLSISRVSGRPGQRGQTRTGIKVTNLKSQDGTTILFSTDDVGGGQRFTLVRKRVPQ